MSALPSSIFIHNSNYGEMKLCFLNNNKWFIFIDTKFTVVKFHSRFTTIAPTLLVTELLSISEKKTNTFPFHISYN